jgi:CBS domain containing-hemolysin-like protein
VIGADGAQPLGAVALEDVLEELVGEIRDTFSTNRRLYTGRA